MRAGGRAGVALRCVALGWVFRKKKIKRIKKKKKRRFRIYFVRAENIDKGTLVFINCNSDMNNRIYIYFSVGTENQKYRRLYFYIILEMYHDLVVRTIDIVINVVARSLKVKEQKGKQIS